MLTWLRSLVGTTPAADRRKFARYAVPAPLEVTVGGDVHSCRVENVSAGGVRLSPTFTVAKDDEITVTDPRSGLALDGRVVGSDPSGVRVRFESEDAGIIVSAWLRISNESNSSEEKAAR